MGAKFPQPSPVCTECGGAHKPKPPPAPPTKTRTRKPQEIGFNTGRHDYGYDHADMAPDGTVSIKLRTHSKYELRRLLAWAIQALEWKEEQGK